MKGSARGRSRGQGEGGEGGQVEGGEGVREREVKGSGGGR